jgi:flagellar protein FlaJ
MDEPTKQDENVPQKNFLKQLMLSGRFSKFTIYLISLVIIIVCIVFAVLSFFGVIPTLEIAQEDGSTIIIGAWYDYLIFAAMGSTGLIGIYDYLRYRKIRLIDYRFPDFVRDLAESRRAGMTFTKAIMNSAKGHYGVLTEEIKKISMQISWGSSVENALKDFASRTNTKLIKRTVSLIIEASRSGGNVADVLDAASKDARELKLIESERRAGMLSYVAVIYVSMFVFLVIIVILIKSLIPSMMGEGAAGLQGTMGVGGGGLLSQADVTFAFFSAGVLQAGFMGIVAGVFEQGNIISGIKHSFIMIVISWIILKFLVGGI